MKAWLQDVFGCLLVAAFAATLLMVPDCEVRAKNKAAPAAPRHGKAEGVYIDPTELLWGTQNKETEEFRWSTTLPRSREVLPDPPEIDPADPFGIRRGVR